MNKHILHRLKVLAPKVPFLLKTAFSVVTLVKIGKAVSLVKMILAQLYRTINSE